MAENMNNRCINCRYKELFNDNFVCTYEVHNNHGSPEELDLKGTCENYVIEDENQDMDEQLPILCPKCNSPNIRTYKFFIAEEMIDCDKCKFKFKNPCFVKSLSKIKENVHKAGDC